MESGPGATPLPPLTMKSRTVCASDISGVIATFAAAASYLSAVANACPQAHFGGRVWVGLRGNQTERSHMLVFSDFETDFLKLFYLLG